jgi:hypothetical protein
LLVLAGERASHAGEDRAAAALIDPGDEFDRVDFWKVRTPGNALAVFQRPQAAERVGERRGRAAIDEAFRHGGELPFEPRIGLLGGGKECPGSAALGILLALSEHARLLGQLAACPEIQLRQNFDFPTIQHVRPDGRQVGARHEEQHVEPLLRADLLDETADQLWLRRVESLSEVRHEQMFVDEKLERVAVLLR